MLDKTTQMLDESGIQNPGASIWYLASRIQNPESRSVAATCRSYVIAARLQAGSFCL
jgi:hypothetical protein